MKKEIILLFIINVLSAVGYSFIAPLFPPIAMQKGVTEYTIGFIFSCFAISNVITIPMTPNLIRLYGRINLMYFSLILESVCTIFFGFLDLISNAYIFSFLSIISRFAHGIGAALCSTLVYSISASLCNESEIKSTIGLIEAAYSLGLMVGPVFASILFNYFGYSFPFIFCALLKLGCIGFIKILDVEQNECEDIQFFQILFNKNIIFSFVAIVIEIVSLTFFFPIFSHHLMQNFGFSVVEASFFFIINMFSYFTVMHYINEINNMFGIKLTIIIGLIGNSIGILLIHPIGFLPQSWVVIVIGLFINGIAGAFITIPGIVDFMDTIKIEMKINESSANDLASALFNLAINCGDAIGPTYGGFITNKYKFETACKGTSLLNISYALFYSFINFNIIKMHFNINNDSQKEPILDKEYGDLKCTTELVSSKDKFKDMNCYTTRNRGYSSSSVNSKKKSLDSSTPQN